MAIYQGIDTGTTKKRTITIKSGWGGNPSVAQNAKPGRKIIALPSNMVTFRNFPFPFQDKKRIKNVLAGELADSVILPIEEMVWDVVSIHKDNAQTIAAVKKQINKYIKEQGNSAQVIDAEPCALMRVAAFNNIKDALIIDIGASHTTFCGVKEGRLNLLRVRMWGGNHIDTAISQTASVPLEKAEEIKIAEGLHNKTVRKCFDSLMDSVSLSAPLEYEQIILTGGVSQAPGLTGYMEEKLQAKAGFFKLPSSISPFYDVIAFGAAIHEKIGEEKINLRKDHDAGEKKSFYWLALLLIPLLIFSISLKMEEIQLKKENLEIRNAMIKAVRSEFPNMGRIDSPYSQARAMIRQGDKGEENVSRKIVPILDNISQSAAGLDISFYELDFTDKFLRIRGDTDSFQGVERFKVALSQFFESVEEQEQKKKPDNRIDFTIRVNLSNDGRETGRSSQ